ncbi:MAG: flagellar hook-length control protein FliK [Desulfobacterales bacterium]|nr:flagellar hook-length control protein FliK [Desulfobacterales bacterium]
MLFQGTIPGNLFELKNTEKSPSALKGSLFYSPKNKTAHSFARIMDNMVQSLGIKQEKTNQAATVDTKQNLRVAAKKSTIDKTQTIDTAQSINTAKTIDTAQTIKKETTQNATIDENKTASTITESIQVMAMSIHRTQVAHGNFFPSAFLQSDVQSVFSDPNAVHMLKELLSRMGIDQEVSDEIILSFKNKGGQKAQFSINSALTEKIQDKDKDSEDPSTITPLNMPMVDLSSAYRQINDFIFNIMGQGNTMNPMQLNLSSEFDSMTPFTPDDTHGITPQLMLGMNKKSFPVNQLVENKNTTHQIYAYIHVASTVTTIGTQLKNSTTPQENQIEKTVKKQDDLNTKNVGPLNSSLLDTIAAQSFITPQLINAKNSNADINTLEIFPQTTIASDVTFLTKPNHQRIQRFEIQKPEDTNTEKLASPNSKYIEPMKNNAARTTQVTDIHNAAPLNENSPLDQLVKKLNDILDQSTITNPVIKPLLFQGVERIKAQTASVIPNNIAKTVTVNDTRQDQKKVPSGSIQHSEIATNKNSTGQNLKPISSVSEAISMSNDQTSQKPVNAQTKTDDIILKSMDKNPISKNSASQNIKPISSVSEGTSMSNTNPNLIFYERLIDLQTRLNTLATVEKNGDVLASKQNNVPILNLINKGIESLKSDLASQSNSMISKPMIPKDSILPSIDMQEVQPIFANMTKTVNQSQLDLPVKKQIILELNNLKSMLGNYKETDFVRMPEQIEIKSQQTQVNDPKITKLNSLETLTTLANQLPEEISVIKKELIQLVEELKQDKKKIVNTSDQVSTLSDLTLRSDAIIDNAQPKSDQPKSESVGLTAKNQGVHTIKKQETLLGNINDQDTTPIPIGEEARAIDSSQDQHVSDSSGRADPFNQVADTWPKQDKSVSLNVKQDEKSNIINKGTATYTETKKDESNAIKTDSPINGEKIISIINQINTIAQAQADTYGVLRPVETITQQKDLKTPSMVTGLSNNSIQNTEEVKLPEIQVENSAIQKPMYSKQTPIPSQEANQIYVKNNHNLSYPLENIGGRQKQFQAETLSEKSAPVSQVQAQTPIETVQPMITQAIVSGKESLASFRSESPLFSISQQPKNEVLTSGSFSEQGTNNNQGGTKEPMWFQQSFEDVTRKKAASTDFSKRFNASSINELETSRTNKESELFQSLKTQTKLSSDVDMSAINTELGKLTSVKNIIEEPVIRAKQELFRSELSAGITHTQQIKEDVNSISTPETRAFNRQLAMELISQIERQLVRAVPIMANEIRFQLSPPHLGRLHMQIETIDDHMKVNIIAEEKSTRDLLVSYMADLKTALLQQGIQLDKMDVQFTQQFDQAMADTGQGQNGAFERRRKGSRQQTNADQLADEDSGTNRKSSPIGQGIVNLMA